MMKMVTATTLKMPIIFTQENNMNRTQAPSARKRAFTLIELLTVIAIIGILAGILIPTIGQVQKRASIATSKAKLSQYLTALQSFKGEYGYYPFSSILNGDHELDLSSTKSSKSFVETLSARLIDNPSRSTAGDGNRRRIQFYNFTEDEISDGLDYESIKADTIVDSFGNNDIRIVFDHDNDGVVRVPDPDGSITATKEIRASVTAYVKQNEVVGAPMYYIYE